MMIKALSLILLAALAAAKNPTVITPKGMTYNAGSTLDITWKDAETGYVNIDIVAVDGKTLEFPMMIASGVPAQACHYTWNIPAELKSSSYQLRVWGAQQPQSGEQAEGVSPKFTILNTLPNAVNTFRVITPNAKQACEAGTTCQITWDYPLNTMHPAMVDVALYRVGNPNPIAFIGTFDSTAKGASWNVPNDPSLLTGDVYISVSGSGMPIAGPGMSNDMGGNSQSFMVAAPGTSQTTESKEGKEEKKSEKKTPKKMPRPVDPKVKGVTEKKANDADSMTVGIGSVAVVLGLTLLSMYI